MNSPKLLPVFEHSSLYVREHGLSQVHFDALVKYNDLHGGKYFRIGHRKITFRSYVGVVQVGNLIIEVLPKTDKRTMPGEVQKWRGVLLTMLASAGYIRLNQTDEAALHTSRTKLLDIYLYMFLEETEKLVHAGLVKRYRKTKSNNSLFKGRLLIHEQIRHNTVHKERFFTEYSVYDRDHICNQLLKAALCIIRDTSFNMSIKQDSVRLLLDFEDVSTWQGKDSDWQKVAMDRKTQPYAQALELAKLIIRGYSPDFKAGRVSVIALLFDMNLLYERYVFRMLKKAEPLFLEHNLLVAGQASQPFWAHKTIRPDIIVSFRMWVDGLWVNRKVIIDTKWKIIENGAPSDSDLRQLYVYNRQLAADYAVLLYPSVGQPNRGPQPYKPGLRDDWTHSCEMYFGWLFVEGTRQLDKGFAHKFLAYLVHPQQP